VWKSTKRKTRGKVQRPSIFGGRFSFQPEGLANKMREKRIFCFPRALAFASIHPVMNNNTKPTYTEIAQSLNLWRTYVDIDGHDTEEAFASTPWQDRVAMMVEMYGPEEEGGMIEA
jgi:hypothetical protein